MSEKKHILDGGWQALYDQANDAVRSPGGRVSRTAEYMGRVNQAVDAAAEQMDSIHAQVMACAAELPNFKPMVSGTGLEVQVANLVAFLRSELEAEKLNTAQMIAIDNKRGAHAVALRRVLELCECSGELHEAPLAVESLAKDRRALQAHCDSVKMIARGGQERLAELEHYRDLAMGVCIELGMTREAVAGDVLHAAVDEVRKLREDRTESARAHIRTVEGVAEKLVKELADANTQIEQARAQLERERRNQGMGRPELSALRSLGEFAGVRDMDATSPLDLIGKITDSLKAVMTAHDEDTRRIQELLRVHKDREEWGHAIGRALDALPDSVKASLGDMTCVPECIGLMGRTIERLRERLSEENRNGDRMFSELHSIRKVVQALPEAVRSNFEASDTIEACVVKLGRMAEDVPTYRSQVEGLNKAIASLQAEVGPLRAAPERDSVLKRVVPLSPTRTGEWLQTSRRALGISQAGLAEIWQVSQATISRWERSETVPPLVAEAMSWRLKGR